MSTSQVIEAFVVKRKQLHEAEGEVSRLKEELAELTKSQVIKKFLVFEKHDHRSHFERSLEEQVQIRTGARKRRREILETPIEPRTLTLSPFEEKDLDTPISSLLLGSHTEGPIRHIPKKKTDPYQSFKPIQPPSLLPKRSPKKIEKGIHKAALARLEEEEQRKKKSTRGKQRREIKKRKKFDKNAPIFPKLKILPGLHSNLPIGT